MNRDPMTLEDVWGVYAVPPLPRKADAARSLDLDAAERLAQHVADGGITKFLYGGNAFLYHVTLDEYADLLGWLDGFPEARTPIPSLGPSYGRAIDQAKLFARYSFPCAMMLPCSDPRDARGLEAGLREVANTAGAPLIVYLKSEDAFGNDLEAGLDAVARLVDDGVCVAIKYAVVREDPLDDRYLASLLARVDRRRVISGMGERPAIVHFQDFDLGGLTTGSGCIAPFLCSALLSACDDGNWHAAEALRAEFMPLEDLRDGWGPARVLHHAVELAGVASTGPIPPYVSALNDAQLEELAPVARRLRERNA
ncbi:MAG TPA: dihydrodipicolinate synthase family protein [Vicinamibacterales bacterium]|nr:dihydrodipicolinate synthase family protein [Vicinamibacterales bacterium]